MSTAPRFDRGVSAGSLGSLREFLGIVGPWQASLDCVWSTHSGSKSGCFFLDGAYVAVPTMWFKQPVSRHGYQLKPTNEWALRR